MNMNNLLMCDGVSWAKPMGENEAFVSGLSVQTCEANVSFTVWDFTPWQQLFCWKARLHDNSEL